MGAWPALVIISLIAFPLIFTAVVTASREKSARIAAVANANTEWEERFARLEARLENLETVILEQEKLQRFDVLHEEAPRQESRV